MPERQVCDMQAGGVTCDMVPETTTTWTTSKIMPVACVSTVAYRFSIAPGLDYDTHIHPRANAYSHR